MRCFCSCIWGNPDPGPVRLRDVQQVVLDTNRMGTVVSVCLPVMLVCVCITLILLGIHQDINLGQLSLSIRHQSLACS